MISNRIGQLTVAQWMNTLPTYRTCIETKWCLYIPPIPPLFSANRDNRPSNHIHNASNLLNANICNSLLYYLFNNSSTLSTNKMKTRLKYYHLSVFIYIIIIHSRT